MTEIPKHVNVEQYTRSHSKRAIKNFVGQIVNFKIKITIEYCFLHSVCYRIGFYEKITINNV